jgi:hypothetical protein
LQPFFRFSVRPDIITEIPCAGGINYGAMTNTPEMEPKVLSTDIDLAKLPILNSSNVRSEYCNLVQVFPTTWDFRITFSEIVVQSPTDVKLELRGNIVMTPQHAKAFAFVLDANIKEYEKNNGEIKWPSVPTEKR